MHHVPQSEAPARRRGADLRFERDGRRIGQRVERRASPVQIGRSAAWLIGDLARWKRHPLAIHDLLLTDSVGSAERLLAERGLRAALLDPHDPAAADRLYSLIIERLCTGHRVALKLATREQRGFAGELAGWLRREGLRVRLDPPGSWRGRETIRDDVAVLLPGAGCPVLPGKINLVCGSARRPAADANLPMSRPETLALAICDAIAECHPRRLAVPIDPPLVPNPDVPWVPTPGASAQRARLLSSGGLPLPA